jgi:hypothetical protein
MLQLRAAELVMSHCVRLVELLDLAKRVSELEAAVTATVLLRHSFLFALQLAFEDAGGGYFPRMRLVATEVPAGELPEWTRWYGAWEKVASRHPGISEAEFRERGGLDDGQFLQLAHGWAKYRADGSRDPLPDELFGCPPIWVWEKYRPAVSRAWKAGQRTFTNCSTGVPFRPIHWTKCIPPPSP